MMKKLLIFLCLSSLFACNPDENQNETVKKYFTVKTVYVPTKDYVDSFNVLKGDDGREYIEGNTYIPYNNFSGNQIIHDTVRVTIHDTIRIESVKKGIKLLCVHSGPIIQNNRIHDGTSDLVDGKVYTTIVHAYLSRDTNDSVYYIDGVGEKLINRFVKIN